MHGLSYASKPVASGTGRLNKISALCAATMLLAGCGQQQVRGGNPVQPGPPQMVHLIWKTNTWMVKLNNGGEENPKTAKIALPKGTGPTMFVVDIAGYPTASFKDPGGLDVWENSKGSNPGINSPQILGPIITKQGNLVFYDLDQGNPVTLYFSLNFNNGVPSVDPIIDNGGTN